MRKVVHKRINITLPESTLQMLETVVDSGRLSRLIDRFTLKRADVALKINVGLI